MSITHYNITDLYAVCNEVVYNITNLKLSMALGNRAECTFVVTSVRNVGLPQPNTTAEVNIATSTEDLHSKFSYGQYMAVYQNGSSHDELFCGYILNVGNSFLSGPQEIASRVTITLVTGATLYNNEAVIQPQYLTRKLALLPESTYSKTMAQDVTAKYIRDGKIDIAQFTALLIDWRDEQLHSKWPDGKTTPVFSKVSEVIDLDTAPKLKWNAHNRNSLIKTLEQQILAALQKSPGISVFESIISNFFMVVAPTPNRLKVIANAGIAKKTQEITNKEILGYQLYPSQYRADKYTTVATTLPGQATVIYALTMGHDANGKPVVKEYKHRDIYNLVNNAEKSGFILPYGAVSYVPIPAWAMFLQKPDKDKTNKNERPSDAVLRPYLDIAQVLTKGSVATGGGFSGRMVIGVLPTHYNKVCYHIGEVFKIDFSNETTGKKAVRYGRLIDINYSVDATKDNLSASLSLAFDCVLTQEEYDKFSIDPAAVGFMKK